VGRIEPGDGRLIITVTAIAPSGPNAQFELVADTGSNLTLVPYGTVQHLISKRNLGRLLSTTFGYVVEIRGLRLELEVIDGVMGSPWIVGSSSSIYGHFLDLAQVQPFLSAQGILGMDVFDDINADPVKSRNGKWGYLLRRM